MSSPITCLQGLEDNPIVNSHKGLPREVFPGITITDPFETYSFPYVPKLGVCLRRLSPSAGKTLDFLGKHPVTAQLIATHDQLQPRRYPKSTIRSREKRTTLHDQTGKELGKLSWYPDLMPSENGSMIRTVINLEGPNDNYACEIENRTSELAGHFTSMVTIRTRVGDLNETLFDLIPQLGAGLSNEMRRAFFEEYNIALETGDQRFLDNSCVCDLTTFISASTSQEGETELYYAASSYPVEENEQ